MKRFTLLAACCLAMLLVGAGAFAEGTTAKKAAPTKVMKPALTTFLIESPHSAEECLKVMDEVNQSKGLASWDWGCMAGNHTAYRIVQAADENAALAMVPEDVRAKAHVHKLTKMTPAQLTLAHKHM